MTLLTFVAVGLFILASSSLPELAPHSVTLRILGAIIVLLALVRRPQTQPESITKPFKHGMLTIGSGFALSLASSLFMHGNVRATMLGFSSFILVGILVYAIVNYYRPSTVLRGTFSANFLIVVVSLILFVAQPGIAVENERLRGVVENANGLGFVAFCLGVLSLSIRTTPWFWVPALASAGAAIALSGSRASALSLAVFLILAAAFGSKRSGRVLAASAPIVVILWLYQPELFTSLTLLRTIDTRSGGFDAMQSALETSPWIGVGLSSSETFVAGSVFAMGIGGGLVGLVGLCLMYFGMIRISSRSRPFGAAFVIACIFHSCFESWMLSFSSPMTLMFFMVTICSLMSDRASTTQPYLSRESAYEPAPSGQGSVRA